ncbi:NEFA-interacting nuclear protein NIP30, partial [Coemansia spiralis]
SSRFISESAIEEARKERETAWKRAYETADGKHAPPDQEYDPRTLYEQLQEQKRRKTEAYAESRRFANQIRKLDTEEIEFLETVDEENIKKYENSRRSEISELAKFKE